MQLKKNYRKILLTTAMAIVLVVQFQNCAQNLEGEQEFASLTNASTIDQLHRDYTHGDDVPTEPQKALEISTLLMDRMTIYTFFMDILGPEAAKLNGMKRILIEKAVFGGPCSVYDNFKSQRAGGKTDSEATACSNSENASNLAAPIEPNANVLHQALVNQVCQEAIANAKTYKYVADQIKGTAAAGVAENSPQNVLRLFSLFYRGKPAPDSQVIESLQFLVGYPATDNGWKLAFLTTCVSSHWQAL